MMSLISAGLNADSGLQADTRNALITCSYTGSLTRSWPKKSNDFAVALTFSMLLW